MMNYELSTILKKIKGNFICVYEGVSKEFSTKEEFEQNYYCKTCSVSTISTQNNVIVLELQKWEAPIADNNSEWEKEYEKQYGEQPSFF